MSSKKSSITTTLKTNKKVTGNNKVTGVEKTKIFLEKNKIFFETVTATALTIMAVIVAVAQLVVTSEQTKYLEQQTNIERAQASPQFVIDLTYLVDEKTQIATEDQIQIYNQGNIAREIQATPAIFFKLTYRNKNETIEKLVPIIRYYWTTQYSGDATGLVITLRGRNNVLKRAEIGDNLQSITESNGVIINLEVKRYIKLSYKDIFNNAYTEYHLVSVIGGSQILSIEEGQVLFEKYENSISDGTIFNLDTLVAQDLYNLFVK